MNNAFQQKLRQISSGIPQLIKRLPGIAKVEGLKFIADNFKNEGFEKMPGNYEKWPERKTAKRKKKMVGEKRGGRLKRGWHKETKAAASHVEFTSSLPYAEVHNEGLKAGRPPGFTMKQSKMIGESEALDKRIENKFDREVVNEFR